MVNESDKILSVDCRSLRDMGNSVGQTLDKEALRELGVVDEDGHALEDIQARQIIYASGRVEIQIDNPDTDALDVSVTDD
jgi:hypothetical protein